MAGENMNQKQAADAIRKGDRFKASALSGRVMTPTRGDSGRLYGVDQAAWNQLADRGEMAYVVFSYGTPIAWVTTSQGWTLTMGKQSVTTSRHLGIVKRTVLAHVVEGFVTSFGRMEGVTV